MQCECRYFFLGFFLLGSLVYTHLLKMVIGMLATAYWPCGMSERCPVMVWCPSSQLSVPSIGSGSTTVLPRIKRLLKTRNL